MSPYEGIESVRLKAALDAAQAAGNVEATVDLMVKLIQKEVQPDFDAALARVAKSEAQSPAK